MLAPDTMVAEEEGKERGKRGREGVREGGSEGGREGGKEGRREGRRELVEITCKHSQLAQLMATDMQRINQPK